MRRLQFLTLVCVYQTFVPLSTAYLLRLPNLSWGRYRVCNTKTVQATCSLQPDPTAPFPLHGVVEFEQSQYCEFLGDLKVSVRISGFPASSANQMRGFHIHQLGDISNGCSSTGGHYNPLNMDHASPTSELRHVGDLGNIPVRADGTVSYSATDKEASLFGEFSVLGRAVVIHSGTDDLGRGGNAGSRRTGNAGSRLACCVIGRKS